MAREESGQINPESGTINECGGSNSISDNELGKSSGANEKSGTITALEKSRCQTAPFVRIVRDRVWETQRELLRLLAKSDVVGHDRVKREGRDRVNATGAEFDCRAGQVPVRGGKDGGAGGFRLFQGPQHGLGQGAALHALHRGMGKRVASRFGQSREQRTWAA